MLSFHCTGVAHFDADLFNFTRAEACLTDPQQRIMLEISHETLATARERVASVQVSKISREGVVKEDLNTGVFCGISYNEYAQAVRSAHSDVSPYTATGGSLSVVPGMRL